MVLDYFPLGFNKIDKFFNDFGYDKKKQLDIIANTMDDRFCTYREDDGTFCGKKTRNIMANNCCTKHLKYLYPELYKEYRKKHQKNYYIKKDKKDINYCISSNKRNERCGTKVKHEGDLCKKHINKKEKYFYFGCIEIKKDIEENRELKKIDINNKTESYDNFKNINLKNKILFGKNMIQIKNNEEEKKINTKNEPLVFNKISKDDLNYCLKNGIKNYTDISSKTTSRINYYDLNNRRIDIDKFLKIYKENKIMAEYIRNNKKYIYLKNNNINKSWYYNEKDIRNLLESFRLRYDLLIEDIYNYGKKRCLEFIELYDNDINKYIIEFYNIDNKFKLYL